MSYDDHIPLADEVRRRYLNYALSVITSRALPDVRDGLKPVQRRILYAMYTNLHLYPDARFKKCASVVGDVLGKYHPHGDTACYEALVRMAQDFSLRYPLVDGQGNFGSLDGDAAAAYRYTEAKLRPMAMELLEELKSKTVPFRPNFDGTLFEPIVLPARVPNLLINGTTGIAVGMATNIPPHNLREVTDALVALIDNPALEVKDLIKYVKGPDFPTGGEIVISKKELRELYETGQGAVRMRGDYEVEEGKRGSRAVVITAIPYGISKATIVERIAAIILARKLPQLTDVRDESTDKVRIVCEIKRDADPALVMAYLYKQTPLSSNFNVNLTCLVPTENPEIGAPERVSLKQALKHFLDFRFDVVTKRLQHELDELERRIHILEGFKKIYDALDEAIRIIRKSDGKEDAAKKLMVRFKLDDEQVDAILELKLYKLARLEIKAIMDELAAKKKAAEAIRVILKSEAKRWALIKKELQEVAAKHGDKRLTRISGSDDAPEFTEEQFIVHEDANVIVTRDGWVKRVRELKDIATTRVREGDEVMAALFGSTLKPVVFFTNYGSAYVTRINDIPPSTGYGEPIQKLFKFDDGERVIGAMSLDPRTGIDVPAPSATDEEAGEKGDPLAPPHLVAITKKGYGLRFSLLPHTVISTRSGRRYARVGEGDEIVGVALCEEKDPLIVVTQEARVLTCTVGEVNLLAGPGRGVIVIKVGDEDAVLGFAVGKTGEIVVETKKGKEVHIGAKSYQMTSRGGRGHEMAKNDAVARLVPPPVTVPSRGEEKSDDKAGGGSGRSGKDSEA